MSFGDRLLEVLEEKGITQKDFASTLNIAASTLNGYIRNNRQPDFELVKNIARILNVSIDYLFDYNGNGFNLTSKELSLITKMRTLKNEQQEIIYDLICISAEKREQCKD